MSTLGKHPRLVGAALLFVVFIAGVAVGLAFDRPMPPPSSVLTVRAIDMSGELDRLQLTSRQRAQVDSIMQRRAPATEATMLDVADRLRAISDSVDAELRKILTPPQRARLDSLRSGRKIMLKRKVIGAGGTTVVDTVFPRRR